MLACYVLGVLDGRVFSRVVQLRTDVVDSLPDTGSSGGVRLDLGGLGLDVGRWLNVQGRDISNGSGLVVESGRIEVGASRGVHCKCVC